MLSHSLILILKIALDSQANGQSFYNLKDLEVLERDKNFEEFLLHVNDIRPSEREKHWRDMYQNMAMSLIDYKIKTKDFSPEAYRKIEDIARSSSMKNDEFFQLKRSIYVKKYFSECFKKAGLVVEKDKQEQAKYLCESEISSFWFFSKKDAELGLDLAKIIEGNGASLKLWPFYSPATKDSIASFYCKKTEVTKAIFNKFYEESFSAEFNGNYQEIVDRTISSNCFKELITPLKETIASVKSNGLDKELALNILESKGKLTKDELDLYAILFLLDGPVVGDKMNIAWKKVEALNESFDKRQKLLEEIKNLPLLPDKIFKDPNLPRNKAIINLFAKNFPEYLNYYGSTCVKFISNTGQTPLNVASSFQCNEFLKAAETEKKNSPNQTGPWLSDSIQSQYSALKK